MSHIECLKVDKSVTHIIVCEDDVELKPNFLSNLNKAIDELPENWVGLWLGGTKVQGKNYAKRSELLARTYGTWGMFGYVINADYAELCINALSVADATADAILIKLMSQYPFYITINSLVSHRIGYSYIAKKHRALTWLT